MMTAREAVEAFLIDAYGSLLARLSARFRDTPVDVEAAVQEAMLRAWQHSEQEPPIRTVQAWIRVAATRLLLDELDRLNAEERAAVRAYQPVQPDDFTDSSNDAVGPLQEQITRWDE